jgi:tmRNA-binding protein
MVSSWTGTSASALGSSTPLRGRSIEDKGKSRSKKMTLGGLTMLDIVTGMTRWSTDGISNVPTSHINMNNIRNKLRLSLLKTKKQKQQEDRQKRKDQQQERKELS